METKQLKIQSAKNSIQSFKAKEDAKRSLFEKFADLLTDHFGTVGFLVLNAVWFFVWIIINTEVIPGVKAFDPFPFGLLTMIVSLEAIFLAIIVLISQNREAKVADLREEIDLHVNLIAEEEIGKIIKVLGVLLEKNNVDINSHPDLKEIFNQKEHSNLVASLEKNLNDNKS